MQSPPTVCDNVCQPSNLQRFHCLGFREDGNCLDGRLLLLIDVSFKPIFLQTLEFLLVNSCTAEKCFFLVLFQFNIEEKYFVLIFDWKFGAMLQRNIFQICDWFFLRLLCSTHPFQSFELSIFNLLLFDQTAIYGIQYTAVFTNIVKDIAMHLYKTPIVGNILVLYSPL